MGTAAESVVGFVLVALGSALGGVARYCLSLWIERRRASGWPLGTLLVNFSGAFLIGLLLAIGTADLPPRESLASLLFVTGFLGSYTTVSAFSLQVLLLIRERRAGAALAYLVLTLAGGLALTAFGYWLGIRLGA